MGHVLPPLRAHRIKKQPRMCLHRPSLVRVVSLSSRGSGSGGAHRALLAPVSSGRARACPGLLLERPLGLSLEDCRGGLWPCGPLARSWLVSTGTLCLPTASPHYCSWLPWIREEFLFASPRNALSAGGKYSAYCTNGQF